MVNIDQTTYNDLALFASEGEFSVFSKLDFTRTTGGRERLRRIFLDPHSDPAEILQTQQILQLIAASLNQWPAAITNGTLMVIERFYDSQIDTIPASNDPVNAALYKALHSVDYGLIRFSMRHFKDFVKGMSILYSLLSDKDTPSALDLRLRRIKALLQAEQVERLITQSGQESLSLRENLFYGRFFRNFYRHKLQELIDLFHELDAWYSMACAIQTYQLNYPELLSRKEPEIEAKGLWHVLLSEPVSYDITLSPQSNFLFLTGANMAGKSTFIKSVGIAVYLAHLGMGVPAMQMRLSVFDGILSNINVADNIVKGESYFFNEVQRIKNTIIKINDGRHWLVLIDELFKGTNVQDAMKCSTAVIKGLIRIKSSLFILSTHLYEIGEELESFPNISFRYFETQVQEGQLYFSYQLMNGVSNDRLGYLILKREGVEDLLNEL